MCCRMTARTAATTSGSEMARTARFDPGRLSSASIIATNLKVVPTIASTRKEQAARFGRPLPSYVETTRVA